MTTPGLKFTLTAESREFEREIAAASALVNREVAKMGAAAQRFDQNVARATGGSLRNFGNVAQQAGFQIGDFATQVASGGNPLVAFTQQATQLLGAFGPWGAVIGAAGATVGALATFLLDAGDSAEETDRRLRELALSTGGLEGGVRDLTTAAEAYATAISATATAQGVASEAIIADTRAEFEAKRALLELEIKRQQAAQAARQAEIGRLQGELSAGPSLIDTTTDPEAALVGGVINERRLAEFQRATAGYADEIKRLRAEAELADIAIRKAIEASEAQFSDLAASGGSGAGGGGAVRAQADAFADLIVKAQERIQQLARERDAVGATAEEVARASASYEANKLAWELLTAAKETGGRITEAEVRTIEATVAAYSDAAESLIAARVAQEGLAAAQRATEESAENSKRAIEAVGNAITNGITQADSFADALRNVGVQLANIAIQGLFGAGPAGGFFNDLLGVGADGLAGAIFGSINAKGNAFSSGRVIPFASGGVVGGPTVFPMAGGRTGLMGEAGPEAIMPLTRGPGGKLGVQASGETVIRVIMSPEVRGEILSSAAANTRVIVQQEGPATTLAAQRRQRPGF